MLWLLVGRRAVSDQNLGKPVQTVCLLLLPQKLRAFANLHAAIRFHVCLTWRWSKFGFCVGVEALPTNYPRSQAPGSASQQPLRAGRRARIGGWAKRQQCQQQQQLARLHAASRDSYPNAAAASGAKEYNYWSEEQLAQDRAVVQYARRGFPAQSAASAAAAMAQQPPPPGSETFASKLKRAWHIFFPPQTRPLNAREAGKNR